MDDLLLDNDISCVTETKCETVSDTSVIESALKKKILCILTTEIINSEVSLMVCEMT